MTLLASLRVDPLAQADIEIGLLAKAGIKSSMPGSPPEELTLSLGNYSKHTGYDRIAQNYL